MSPSSKIYSVSVWHLRGSGSRSRHLSPKPANSTTIMLKITIFSLVVAMTRALIPRQLVVPEVAGTVTTCGPCDEGAASCATCDDVDCSDPASVTCTEMKAWVHENRVPDSTFLFETQNGQRYEYSCTSCEDGTESYQCTECQTFPANHCVLPEVHECQGEDA